MPARNVRTVSARRVDRPTLPSRPAPATAHAAPGRPVVRRGPLWALAICVALAALGGGGWRLYNSSFFVVHSHDVRVNGAVTVSPDEVRDAAGIDGSRFFTLDTVAAAGRVMKLPRVASATVQRRFPRGATITIHERTATGVWRLGAIDYAVADDGTVLDTADGADGLPVIDATHSDLDIRPGDRVDADPLRVATHILANLSAKTTRTVIRFEYDRQDGLTVVTEGGALVRLGDGKDLDYKLAVWQGLLQKVDPAQIHELDLRYGDRPFYR